MDRDRDERLELLGRAAVRSLGAGEAEWRELVAEEEKQLLFSSFFSSADLPLLLLYRGPDRGLTAGLSFPPGCSSKLLCVCRTGSEPITMETARSAMCIQEVMGDDPLSFLSAITEQVTDANANANGAS